MSGAQNNAIMNAVGSKGEYDGIIVNAKNPDQARQAQVWIFGIFDHMTTEQMKNELPWCPINTGEGTAGSSGSVHSIWQGQRVKCRTVGYDSWEIVQLLDTTKPEEESGKGGPKGGGGSSGGNKSTGGKEVPTKVKPTPEDEKSMDDVIESPNLLNISVPGLATGIVSKMLGTIFTKANQSLQMMKTMGIGSLKRSISCGEGSPGVCGGPRLPPFGFIKPVISVGDNDCGILDLTKDLTRSVDCEGGSCGNITDLIKVDGWGVDLEQWNLTVMKSNICMPDGSEWKPDDGGNIQLPPGLKPGLAQVEMMLFNNSQTIEQWMDPKFQVGGGEGSQFKKISLVMNVVEDMKALDFSQSVNYIMDKGFNEIGAMTLTDRLPKIEFQLNPKGTDKGEFSQMQVFTGPGKDSVSMEMDYTKKSDPEKVEKGSEKAIAKMASSPIPQKPALSGSHKGKLVKGDFTGEFVGGVEIQRPDAYRADQKINDSTSKITFADIELGAGTRSDND